MNVTEAAGVPVLVWDGDVIGDVARATDVVGEALYAQVTVVVLPVDKLGAEFFDLKTGLAGEVAQKFVNYRLRLAVLGDIESHVAASKSLASLVYEANRGGWLWFVPNWDELVTSIRRAVG